METFNDMSAVNAQEKKFFFCDTTLRDGEQVRGVHYTPQQKMEIASLLAKAGVESIDAGFAATSSEERLAIKMICEADLGMRIMSMCRVVKNDVDHAISCGVDGVILFIPGSDIHIKAKFGENVLEERRKLLDNAVSCIKYAKDKGLFVEFGIEDSSRTEDSVLLEMLAEAEAEGADILGTTDTVGCMTPEKIYTKTRYLTERLHSPVGVHCHNDLGLATANTIAGIMAGAGYVSPTVSGIGERAGNASLEEVIMIMNTIYHNGAEKYDTRQLCRLVKLVEDYSGIKHSPLKPITGENAFTHESGIHIDGMLKNTDTYEFFSPDIVGRQRKYVLGKHIGKSTVWHILRQNGFDLTVDEAAEFWSSVRNNEKLGEIYDENSIIMLYKDFKGGV